MTVPTGPTSLEQIAKGSQAVLYGVPVSFLGEEQESIAAFTLDRRRALAAMSRLVRSEVGDPFAEAYDPTSLAFHWVTVATHCGCVHPDPARCSGETNGDVTCCPVIPATDEYEAQVDDHDCEHYGLPPCIEDLYSWMTTKVPEGTPGALPMWQVDQ